MFHQRHRQMHGHLADMEDFDRYNTVYRAFFKDVAVLPARTTVQSVLWKGIQVEIDFVARKACLSYNGSTFIKCGLERSMRIGFRNARPNPSNSIAITLPSINSIPSPKLNASAPKK